MLLSHSVIASALYVLDSKSQDKRNGANHRADTPDDVLTWMTSMSVQPDTGIMGFFPLCRLLLLPLKKKKG